MGVDLPRFKKEKEPKVHFSQFKMPQSNTNYLDSEYIRIK